MSAGNQDSSANTNDDTRLGVVIDTRGAAHNANQESVPATIDDDVTRVGTHIETRSVLGRVGNETVLSDVMRDGTVKSQ